MVDKESKTLYVGNLSKEVSEELLMSIFGRMGLQSISCKIKRDTMNDDGEYAVNPEDPTAKPGDPYAFIDFSTHGQAAQALSTLNKITMFGKVSPCAPYNYMNAPMSVVSVQVLPAPLPMYGVRPEMKVNWATSGGTTQKQDTSKHFHIFVGDLGQDIEPQHLLEAFSVIGEVSDVKIIKDPASQKSKGYGFVSFINKCDAESAIHKMNGQWIGSRAIRTNWASRKPPAPNKEAVAPKSESEVYKQSSPTNSTVYCGGFDPKCVNLSEELLQKHFSEHGQIQEVRIFKDKGYAFIRFADHSQATRAICAMHGADIEGCPVKCSWGRESGDPNNAANQQQQQQSPEHQHFYYNHHQNQNQNRSSHQSEQQNGISLLQQSAFAASQVQYGAGYYGANVYWPFAATQGQYPQVQQTAGYVQPGVAGQYYNYPVTAAYNPAAVNMAVAGYGQVQVPAGQQAQFNGQQAAMMGYPMQQDYDQSQ
ncbi:nucleolysin TIAR-like [Tubulanus polymorphus]|uniref:nucleolysin TIAR-like n=1 Tax=Tubulanus polymorphus TaxID=672921 RepID=UPI003DA41172